MKLITTLMLLTASFTFGAEETKPKPIEDTLWEKAVSDNTKEAEKTYSAYQKALADATSKVTKALEANIKDLNDSKKFPKLGMKERVEAIEALEEKIKGAKEAVGEIIAKEKDLLGGDGNIDIRIRFIGKWFWNKENKLNEYFTVDKKFNVTHYTGTPGKLEIINDIVYIMWGNNTRWSLVQTGDDFIANGNMTLSK